MNGSINLGYNQKLARYDEAEGQLEDCPSKLFKKKIWRVGDVARFLGCTIGHVYNLASDEKIPKRKKHGLLFFVPDEILDWILQGDEK